MARIRSVHPGFFTDEAVVSVSMAARICIVGLGIEADDKGIFEWKPLMLKMRLFPADNVDMNDLLSELQGVNLVQQYQVDGKTYGAIRNFRRFQKPKTPNDIHPTTDEILNYVGLSDVVSENKEAEEKSFPPKGEKSPQMEDGGWRSSSVSNETGPAPDSDKKFWSDAKSYLGGNNPGGLVGKWCKQHGKEATAKAITAAQLERAVDPIPYVEAVLRKSSRTGQPAVPL